MNQTPQLVDNTINFDPTLDSASTDVQKHQKPFMNNTEAMIAKVTHPPTTVPEFEGLPTNDARTQTVYNMRNVDVLKTPILFNGTDFSTSQWADTTDYSIIVPNGVRIKYFGVTYQTGARSKYYEQDLANVGVQDNFDFKSWRSTVNVFRPVAQSVTLYPNVTAFNNQGIISSQQFNPNVMFGGNVSNLSYNHPELFHKYLDSVYETRPDSLFVREETNADINPTTVDSWFTTRKLKKSGLGIDPDVYLQILSLGKVGYPDDIVSEVPTPSQMLQNSMRSSGGKFIDGCFAVNRINTIAPKWNTAANTNNNVTADGLYECWIYTIAIDGSQHLTPLHENAAPGATPPDLLPMRDTLWTPDMTWTMIRMQGIQANLAFTTSSVATSPIAIKYYQTIEAQPVWNGPWNGVSRMSPKPDLAAMQMLMDTFYEMPDSMPAKYNALGAFLPFLAGAVPHVLGFIKDLIVNGKKKKSSTPDKTVATTSSKLERTAKVSKREKELEKQLLALQKKIDRMSVQPNTKNRPKRKRRATTGSKN